MEIKRFFANAEDYDGSQIAISGEEFTHMTKVLRHKVGYKIIVNLNDGKDYYCSIERIGKDVAFAKVNEIVENDSKPKVSVTLFQALPKGDRLDLAVQKCVELGVDRVAPFLSRYTNESKFNRSRLERIALEACKQCGRSNKVEICELADFSEIADKLKDFDVVIMPYERAKVGKMGEVKGLKEAKNIALIIGSEGGFCDEEVKAVKALGGQVVSLGKRILRCETASIVALSLIMYELGELS
ncbi:MAG: 16S rRNA (uracil(1498)-N(3))-methyltransferase [Clostridia bacterium]|nr:16S rRNA (uracil(1498)-N(3))-methyltransferase [Clostridia bacterium]MDE7329030.1 16S rRNA (uracil(1498)-N(3))-methyltransferase [Clostridia bacterium]